MRALEVGELALEFERRHRDRGHAPLRSVERWPAPCPCDAVLRAAPLPPVARRSIVISTVSMAIVPHTNSELIESSSCVRRMASPSSGATDSTCSRRPSVAASGRSGIVSVTTSSSTLDSASRVERGSRQHRVRRDTRAPGGAPASRTASAAVQSVPAVSTMSSTITAHAPVDVADDLHLGDLVGPGAALVDDGEVRVEPLGERARPLDATGVGRDHRDRRARRGARAGTAAAPGWRRRCRPGR